MTNAPPAARPLRLVLALYTLVLLCGCSSPHKAPKTLEFTLPDLSGTPRTLSDYRGRWVIVNYWATWCKPCLREIPQLIELAGEYRHEDVVVVGIDYEDIALKKLRRFIHDHHIRYAVLRTSPTAAQRLGPILGLPTTYVITPQGDLASTLVGQITRRGIEQLIDTESLRRGLPTPQHD